MQTITRSSPRSLARMAGLFQLLEGVTATFGQVVVLGKLVDFRDAAATATNILSHERLFWLGFASSLIGVIFHIAWALLLYDVLKPVNRRVSLLAVYVILVGCAIQAVTIVLYLTPLLILHAASALNAFSQGQLQALGLVFFRLNDYAFDTYLVFFGLWCLLIGYLIFRSSFLPRILGILLAIAGLAWLCYLSPPLARSLFIPYIAGASALGEIPIMLWLLIVGLHNERWYKQAEAANLCQ